MLALILGFLFSITGPSKEPNIKDKPIISYYHQCNWIVKEIEGPGEIVLVIAKRDCN